MIPILDVIFSVVACFSFLLAVSEARPLNLKVELPEVSGRAAQAHERDAIEVRYDAAGVIEVDGTLVARDGVSARLAELLADDRERPVRLRGDEDARHGLTALLLDAAREAGARRVLVAVRGGGGALPAAVRQGAAGAGVAGSGSSRPPEP